MAKIDAADVARQGMKAKAMEGQVREQPFMGKKVRGGYAHGARVHLFDRSPVNPPTTNAAFTGKGFLPNLFNSHAPVTLYEASASTLENEGVHGRESMMPPAGKLGKLQNGQKTDEGSGGAGSFATVTAFGAKMNG